MSRIVVLGAGLIGLTAALLLGRDGHRVTVLERDPAEPADDAEGLWAEWQRPGVSQFRLPHVMHAHWHHSMEHELPEVLAEVERLGGQRVPFVETLPTAFTGGPRAGDEALVFVQARRPVIEGALARVASRTPGIVVRRGVTAASLVEGRGAVEGVPHVAGVLSGSGELFEADLVVDAMGRRSPLARMLSAIGARRPVEEQDDLGRVYYCRHFRIRGEERVPLVLSLVDLDSMTLLLIPADDNTFSVAFCCASNDRELRALRDEQTWEQVLALFPDLAPARAAAEPITPVQVMSGAEDRHAAFVQDGSPIATGVVAVGDAAMRTNPTLGRGTSIGLTHACVLRDVLREVGTEQPERLVMRFAEAAETHLMPLYRRTVIQGRSRMAEVQADIAGTPHPPPAPDWSLTRGLAALASQNARIMRAYARTSFYFAEPGTAFDEPGLRETFDELAPTLPRYPGTTPTRAQMLAVIRAGAAQHSEV